MSAFLYTALGFGFFALVIIALCLAASEDDYDEIEPPVYDIFNERDI